MSDLPTRRLGQTGLEVTVLGYGAMELRGPNWRKSGRELSPGQAERVLNEVLDAGINFIDTSIDYGASEELIGKHISARRQEYYLASKCGCLVDPALFRPENRDTHIFTRKNITDGVHQSLRRMKTDYLDLVQIHVCPSKEVLEEGEAIEALLDLKREGSIRFLGTSSTLPELTGHIEMGVFDTFMIPYSALERGHEEMVSRAFDTGAGIIIRGGIAQGEPGEGQGNPGNWKLWEAAQLDALRGEASRTEFLLRFTISHPHMHTTIVGTINLKHLHENVAAARKGSLPASVYEDAKRRLSEAGKARAHRRKKRSLWSRLRGR